MAARLQSGLQDFLDSGERLVLPAVEKPQLSILIVLFNKAFFTLGCLRALARDLEPGMEIILQDNGSTDETAALLDRIDNARVLRNGGNLGFLRGANAAAAAAGGEFLLFLNNDAFVHAGSIAAAISILDREPAAGAVVGRLIHPDRRLQEAGAIVWRDGITEGYARGRPADAAEAMFRRVVDYGSGAFLMTRRDAFTRLGGSMNDTPPPITRILTTACACGKSASRPSTNPWRAPITSSLAARRPAARRKRSCTATAAVSVPAMARLWPVTCPHFLATASQHGCRRAPAGGACWCSRKKCRIARTALASPGC